MGLDSLEKLNPMLPPQIIYEDSDILVLNKPFGLITHPKNKNDTSESVVSWLTNNYPGIENIGEPFIASGTPMPRAGVVHRLDRDTSGLILVAKNNESFLFLKSLFQTRKIQKYYQALVAGQLKKPQGIIDSPLGRIGLKWTTKLNGPDAKSIEDPRFGNHALHGPNRDKKMIDKKEAVTEYRTLKKFKKFTLLEVMPKTGRTHQIRVHLNSIGYPVCGDVIYGFKKNLKPPGLTRLFLHAYKLEFITPQGKALTIEVDLPAELSDVLENLS